MSDKKPKVKPKKSTPSKPKHRNGKGDSPRNISEQFKKNYDKLVQRLPIKQKALKKISPILERLRHGGIASISHLTRPI